MGYDLNKIKIRRCSFCEEYYCCDEDDLDFGRFLSKTGCEKCGAPLFGCEDNKPKYVKLKPDKEIGTICFDKSHALRPLQIQWEVLNDCYENGRLYYKIDENKLLLYIANCFEPDEEWSLLTGDIICTLQFEAIECFWQVTRRKYNVSDDIAWALTAEKEQFGRIFFKDDNLSNGKALSWLLNTPPNAKYIVEVNVNQ